MDVDKTASVSAPSPRVSPPSEGYRLEGDKVINDQFLDGFTFWDLLDVINPLQHIPLISNIYRHLTDDELKAGPRLAGGVLFGGVLGLAGAAVNVVLEKTTGKDLGDMALAAVLEDDPGGASPASVAATPSEVAGEVQEAGPISLLPPSWSQQPAQAVASAAPAPSLSPSPSSSTAPSASAGLAARGVAPSQPPLGYDVMTPPGAQAAPAAAPAPALRPGSGSGPAAAPPKVDVILSSHQAQGQAQAQTQTQAQSAEPKSRPLGYDVLSQTGSGVSAAAAQQAQLPPPVTVAGAAGMSLAEYQSHIARSAAAKAYTLPGRGAPLPREPSPAVSTPASVRSSEASFAGTEGLSARQVLQRRLDGAAPPGSQGVSGGAFVSDPAAPAALPSSALPLAPSFGPALNPALVTGPSTASDPASDPAGAARSGEASADGNQAWHVERMMRNLEKYRKARDLGTGGGSLTDA